jgi:hypothetical protein
MPNDTLSLLRSGKLAGSKRLDLSCGLTEFPTEIYDLADTLEVLNLTKNNLSDLPDDLGRLSKLRIVFCSENQFRHVPSVLGELPNLSMVGFKSNQIAVVDEACFPAALRWLILTDNRIRHIPASIGQCLALQKLMLSGNQLKQLPDEMAKCVNLELVRLAANEFTDLPDWLLKLPRLSWLALAGNPLCCPPSIDQQAIAEIPWSELQLLEKLGEGASGIIHKAQWKTTERHVAVKIFKGAVTSDGLPASEMAASLGVGAHPSLVEVLGKITDHPTGTDGLVMSLIDPAYKNLAGPPSLESCTRDIYAETTRFHPGAARRIARGIASAAHQLHARGITHGDLYAHNVLWNEQGDCLLGDFGAACFYPSSLADPLQRIEVRAFGYLLEELLQRCDEADDDLWALQKRCVADDPMARPRFEVILDELK